MAVYYPTIWLGHVLFNHPLVSIWVVPTFWLVRIMLLWTFTDNVWM